MSCRYKASDVLISRRFLKQRIARIHIDAISSFLKSTWLSTQDALRDNPADDLLAQLCHQSHFVHTILTGLGYPLDSAITRDVERMVDAIAESAALVYSCADVFAGLYTFGSQ